MVSFPASGCEEPRVSTGTTDSDSFPVRNIRLVPYSPPRPGQHDNVDVQSRRLSYADGDAPSLPPSSPPPIPNVDIYDWGRTKTSPRQAAFVTSGSRTRQSSPLGSIGERKRSKSSVVDDQSEPSPVERHRRKIIDISVHKDKTFSLQPQDASGSLSSRPESLPWSTTTTGSSSRDRNSSASIPSQMHEHAPYQQPDRLAFPGSHTRFIPICQTELIHRPLELLSDFSQQSTSSSERSDSLDLPKAGSHPELQSSTAALLTLRSGTESTSSVQSQQVPAHFVNYELHGQSSPAMHPPVGHLRSTSRALTSEPDTNYQIHHQSSGSFSLVSTSQEQCLAVDSDEMSGVNYVVHRQPSFDTPAASVINPHSPQVRMVYSRESLVVPPLRTFRGRSGPTSLTHLELQGSPRSLSPKSSSAERKVAHSALTGSNALRCASSKSSRSTSSRRSTRPGSANQFNLMSSIVWNRVLSTVLSESDWALDNPSQTLPSEPLPGRQSVEVDGSARSVAVHASSDRSCALLDPERPIPPVGRPQCALTRNDLKKSSYSSFRSVSDYDENGDGLAELVDPCRRPLRSAALGILSHSSSYQSLHRINSLRSSLPRWATLYYGSNSLPSIVSRPSIDSLLSESRENLISQAPLWCTNPFSGPASRHAAKEIRPLGRTADDAGAPSLDSPVTPLSHSQTRPLSVICHCGSVDSHDNPTLVVGRSIERRTSGVWSPHLRYDKRASGHNTWDPPPAVFKPKSDLPSRLWTLQVVLFFAGFVLPFSWMVGAVLPLPANSDHVDVENMEKSPYPTHADQMMDEFQASAVATRNAKRWRDLNRAMSLVGFVVIAVAITLLVVGMKQQWAH